MRLLVVEDYRPIRIAVAQGLREAGFAVDTSADGREAHALLQADDYDVVILDLMIPGMDGWSLLQELRKKPRSPCVLVLTAKDDVGDRIHGLNLGADDYLSKPFDFQELLARVRALIRRKYDAPSPVVTIADLTINTASKSVARGGRTVELTGKEFALLEYLALRQGQVVSRSEIWERLYDFRSEASSNVVDVYIRYLRQKIETPDSAKLIHTRRGQGYLLGESP